MGTHFYVFGGTDSHNMFKDFWVLELESRKWEEIKKENERDFWPEVSLILMLGKKGSISGLP